MAYEINININGDIGSVGEEATSTTVKDKAKDTQKQSQQSKAQKSFAKFISAQTIEPFLQNVKTQISQNIDIATGNVELQQRVNFGFEMAQFGAQAYGSMQGGIVVASALGLSSLAGATVGLGLTAINTGMQIAFNNAQINLQKRMENYQLRQVQDRQGIAYNRSRR